MHANPIGKQRPTLAHTAQHRLLYPAPMHANPIGKHVADLRALNSRISPAVGVLLVSTAC